MFTPSWENTLGKMATETASSTRELVHEPTRGTWVIRSNAGEIVGVYTV